MTSQPLFAPAALHCRGAGFQPAALFSRALHFGVSYGDMTEVSESSATWTQWSEQLAEKAAHYESSGDRAASKKRLFSALEHWRRAAACYHFAQLRLGFSPCKCAYQAKVRESFLKAAPLMCPPAQRFEIPFAGTTLVGYLRLAKSTAPLVLLIGGLDSAKEVELASFAEQFLARGNSVFFFDGPGQGELWGKLTMKAGFGRAVSAIVDFFQNRRIGRDGIGVFGVSFGGYLACRAAACDRRIRACVCLGGFFDGGVLRRLPETARETVCTAFGLEPGSDVSSLTSRLSLKPLSGLMDRPLLVVHGCDDHLVDEDQISQLERWASGEKLILKMPRAEHVCTNRFPECLPLLADWMAEHVVQAPVELGVEVCPV